MSMSPRKMLPSLDRPLHPGQISLAGAPEGYDSLILASWAGQGGTILHIARDDASMARLAENLSFFAPSIEIIELPAWDCVPYDRVSPNTIITAQRMDALVRIAQPMSKDEAAVGRLILTTVSAVLQRLPRRELLAEASFSLKLGGTLYLDQLLAFLARNGYARADTVMEPGEFAVRGSIIDLFPPGAGEAIRLDLFGDELDSIRTFDPMTQRSVGRLKSFSLKPMSELVLDEAAIARFRTSYRERFGSVQSNDLLYEAVSEGRRYPGMEHWLPLFHDGLDTIFAYLPEDSLITLDYQVQESCIARQDLIFEYFNARVSMKGIAESGAIYHPLPPGMLYLEPEEWSRLLALHPVVAFSPFSMTDGAVATVDAQGRQGRDFSDIRSRPGVNPYDEVARHILDEQAAGRRVFVSAHSLGSRDRLTGLLRDHGVAQPKTAESWKEALAATSGQTVLVAVGIERGFTAGHLCLITEQDILGDRLVRPARRKKRGDQFIAASSELSEGDLVVHVDHGIGRYDGLIPIDVGGAPHDCLRILYDGNDKLFVPVENIEVLSRYGSEQAGVQLDRLGGAAWQSRKAKLKQRIRDMAEQLIRIAAERQVKAIEALVTPDGLYEEFAARFPYMETDDQLRAIEDTIEDLASGKPMDRLICGDVGFGKTEVALRAAFVVAMSGLQVAVVVPTTLLARQHYRNFKARFDGLPLRIAQLSRLVSAKDATLTRKELAEGKVDIIVGTHALLAKSVQIPNLGLLIIDEEQHFGVSHKERLKQLKSNIHVLTMTATPIPRTLQMALSGVREMSLIATPPVDRLAVRTFVLPFDGVVIREAILRERFRGGQCFYVCPRLADIDRVAERLARLVPEIKTVIAHGRLSPTELEDVMAAFSEGTYDVLLSTNIIESGIDMPNVNTIIIHRADMFGLGQLYQLRGRVGRGKVRGYAYLTLPPDRVLPATSQRRLQVMQTLDTLGAGFTLASHDLDIRGAGNLLGEEQSGHIKEVGIELYQHLLEEAVAAARSESSPQDAVDEWTPQITIGTSVLIPDSYIKDLSVRLNFYRRISTLSQRDEIDALAAEMIDRFGPLPSEVENLFEIVALKAQCRICGIEKIDVGPKGAVLTFHNNRFANPAGLVKLINQQLGTIKLRPDHKLVYLRSWETPADKMTGVKGLMRRLLSLVQEVETV